MTTLQEIFELRREVDKLRQPLHAAHVMNLSALVTQHPYDLPTGSAHKLLEQAGCAAIEEMAGTWEDSVAYLYRLQPLAGALYGLQWRDYAQIVADGVVDDYLDDIHNRLLADHQGTGGDWLPLSTYATGALKNDCGFSWWTTLEALQFDAYDSGQRLGLPDRWIPVRGLLLRCPAATAAALARVPTVVDGFCSPIFASMPLDPASLVRGMTIDLRGNGPALRGEPEYALRPVDVEAIEFVPVFIGDRPRPVPWDAITWMRLAAVYEKMKHGDW